MDLTSGASTLSSLAGVWAESMLDWTLKGCALLLAVALATVLWRKSSASARHLLWALGIAGVLLMPLMSAALPAWRVQGLPHLALHISWPDRDATGPVETEPIRGDAQSEAAPATTRDAAAPELAPTRGDGSREGPAGTTASESVADSRPGSTPSTTSRRSFNPIPVFFFLWAAGGLLALVVYLAGAVTQRRILHRARAIDDEESERLAAEVAEKLGLPRAVPLRRSDQTLSPQACGLLRPVILLPREWDRWNEAQRRQVLAHEFAHVARLDCLTQSLAYLACALFWFNPLVWLAARRLRVERERACDDRVLLHGAKPSMYADNLLKIASTMKSPPRAALGGVAMARRTQMSGRLLAVLDPDRPRRRPGRVAMTVAALLFVGLALPLTALQPAEASRTAGPSHADRLQAPQPPDLDEFRAAAAELDRLRIEAFRNDDIGLMADCFTRDFRIYPMGGRTVWDLDGLAEVLEFSRAFGMRDIEAADDELFVIGDMVLTVGRFDALDEAGEKLVGGRYMTLWKKENGQWRIHRDMASH